MKIILFILVAALIAKDTSQLNDPYVMRGLAQGLCIAAGGVWVLGHLSGEIGRRYWPVWGWLVALAVASAWGGSPFYVWLQIASLAAVLLFYVAYFETRAAYPDGGVDALLSAATLLYAIVVVLSLVVRFTHPGIAYDMVENGDLGLEHRFRGLFPKAGMLGSAAGVTFGLVWFSRWRTPVKLAVMAVCGICLALTLSRTFWVALVAGASVTYWASRPAMRKWIAVGVTVSALLGMAIKSLELAPDISHAEFLRADTITNLTGRVGLWEEGMQAFQRSPVLGYGYTAGASGLASAGERAKIGEADLDATRDLGKTTLHNGYLQSLLDSGLVGTSFYLTVIVLAIRRMWRRTAAPRDRAVLFALVYFAVANATQNIIYSASVFDSVMFMGLAIYALRTRDASPATAESQVPVALPPSPGVRYRKGHDPDAAEAS